MLAMTQLAGFGANGGASDFRSIIGEYGLSPNLRLCLDAGDAASYASGAKWLDVSGNGYDFYRGSSSGGDAAEPTFNGVAGGLSSSEYWSFDGGDYFLYDAANETWMENIHKDNANFTLAGWHYMGTLTGDQPLACDYNAQTAATRGFFYHMTGGRLRFYVDNAAVIDILISAPAAISAGQWFFAAVSVNEAVGANGAILMLNGTQELFTSTYTSPNAAASSAVLRLGSNSSGNRILSSGSRMSAFFAWDVALSQAQLLTLFNATKLRFGL